MQRRKTRAVRVGGITIGGGAAVSVQSMTNTDTRNVNETVAQIHRLEKAGCDIVRVAVPDAAAANALKEIKNQINIPLVADIHFDHRLALKALEAGVDKLRINPGNIGAREKVEAVANAASERGVPIRIGVNAGSIDKAKYGPPSAESLANSALDQVRVLEELDFHGIVISLKSFDAPMTIAAYRRMSELVDYPLHIGVTEAGLAWEGTIRSAIGIGALLAEGIGDTLRVSLTTDPVEEVKVGMEILYALDLREPPFTVISCPTCGRSGVDISVLAEDVKDRLSKRKMARPLKVAVMGCAVNGPGEAAMADVGITGGSGVGMIFVKGQLARKVREEELVDELMKEIERIEHDQES
ncbi:MAG: flavodoxin-dependent (E)-4-hydroxy-3-methylbut-2-enyl-diphosphate synthase [Armatimonadota bacterium]|nr:flavodoxin-dependent (E)-4-hydroxy-3-methylbut-2-enyl-diphosphate synthase [Armatimonadota bacterium]